MNPCTPLSESERQLFYSQINTASDSQQDGLTDSSRQYQGPLKRHDMLPLRAGRSQVGFGQDQTEEMLARQQLSTYVVLKLSKRNKDDTWDLADRWPEAQVPEDQIVERVRSLTARGFTALEKLEEMPRELQRQISLIQRELEENDHDKRFQYELIQMESKKQESVKSGSSSMEEGQQKPKSKDKGKGKKQDGKKENKMGKKKGSKGKDDDKDTKRKDKNKAKEKERKPPKSDREPVAVKLYFRRFPRQHQNASRMLEELDAFKSQAPAETSSSSGHQGQSLPSQQPGVNTLFQHQLRNDGQYGQPSAQAQPHYAPWPSHSMQGVSPAQQSHQCHSQGQQHQCYPQLRVSQPSLGQQQWSQQPPRQPAQSEFGQVPPQTHPQQQQQGTAQTPSASRYPPPSPDVQHRTSPEPRAHHHNSTRRDNAQPERERRPNNQERRNRDRSQNRSGRLPRSNQSTGTGDYYDDIFSDSDCLDTASSFTGIDRGASDKEQRRTRRAFSQRDNYREVPEELDEDSESDYGAGHARHRSRSPSPVPSRSWRSYARGRPLFDRYESPRRH